MAARAGGSIKSGLILILLLLFQSASLEALEPIIAPALKVSEKVFRFGEVTEGQKVVATFILQNRGNANLYIQSIVSGCGCTTPVSSPSSIAPGKEKVLTIEFDTSGFWGPQSRIVRLYSNDLVSPVLALKLEGTISSPVAITPDRIDLGELSPQSLEKAEREFSIKLIEEDLVLKNVASYSPYLDLEEVASSSQKERFFRIRFSKQIPVGQFRDRVILSLEGSQREKFNIPIFGMVTEASDP
jgi:hypothetical protein